LNTLLYVYFVSHGAAYKQYIQHRGWANKQ